MSAAANVAGGGAAIMLHADLYPLEAIERAVSAFSGIALFDVEPGAPYHRVVGRAGATDRVMNELANYVLASSIMGAPGEDAAD